MMKAPPDNSKLRIAALLMGRKKPPGAGNVMPPADDISNAPAPDGSGDEGTADTAQDPGTVDDTQAAQPDADEAHEAEADKMLKSVSSQLKDLAAKNPNLPELRQLQAQIESACALLGYGAADAADMAGTAGDKGQWQNDDYLNSLSS